MTKTFHYSQLYHKYSASYVNKQIKTISYFGLYLKYGRGDLRSLLKVLRPILPTCGFFQNDRYVVKCKILKDDSPEAKDIPV
jgi:hypothetical protein